MALSDVDVSETWQGHYSCLLRIFIQIRVFTLVPVIGRIQIEYRGKYLLGDKSKENYRLFYGDENQIYYTVYNVHWVFQLEIFH